MKRRACLSEDVSNEVAGSRFAFLMWALGAWLLAWFWLICFASFGALCRFRSFADIWVIGIPLRKSPVLAHAENVSYLVLTTTQHGIDGIVLGWWQPTTFE